MFEASRQAAWRGSPTLRDVYLRIKSSCFQDVDDDDVLIWIEHSIRSDLFKSVKFLFSDAIFIYGQFKIRGNRKIALKESNC